jgi:hypothetical protein
MMCESCSRENVKSRDRAMKSTLRMKALARSWTTSRRAKHRFFAGILSVYFRGSPNGRASPDLIYAFDEKPPIVQLLALGFQHTAVICPYLVMVALVAGAAKLPHEAARNAISLAMIAVAFLTILQSLRLGRVGSGYLCPRSFRRFIFLRVFWRRPPSGFLSCAEW